MTIDSAIVLAAGEGTRLRPLTAYRPKPMLPAVDRPILERVADALVDGGITELHLVVGYGRDYVQDHFGATYRGVPVHYHHQETRLGTGHALLQAAGAVDGEFLVTNGDEVITAETVDAVVDAHDPEYAATMAIVESEAAPQFGAVRIDGEFVSEFVENPAADDYHYMNAGVYAFDDSIFEAIRSTPQREGERSLADTIAELMADDEAGRIRAVRTHTAAPWVNVMFPWDLLTVARHILSSRDIADDGGEGSRPNVAVADTATVHESTTLVPPVVVSEDCELDAGAVVGPNVGLGRNVTVGANATVRNAVVDADTRIGAGATLFDLVTGRNATVGPGTTVPGGPGDVQVGNLIHRDRHLGAVVADRATLGGGTTVAPGTLVGPEATVREGVVVDGVVAEGTEVTR